MRTCIGLLLLACALAVPLGVRAEDAADAAEVEEQKAQPLAESVVGKPFNADKTLGLNPPASRKIERYTSNLEVHISVVSGGTMSVAGSSVSISGDTSGVKGKTRKVSGDKIGLAKDTSELEKSLSKLNAEVRETEIVIRMLGSVLFAFDKFDLRPDAVLSLREVLQVIQSFGRNPIRVEGHTDSIGSNAYNQKLSEKRAGAVADWLRSHGVAASRITVKGFGETVPVAGNETDEGRQQNRRVEIIIQK